MNSVVKAVMVSLAAGTFSLSTYAAAEGAAGQASGQKGSEGAEWPSFRKADADNSGAISMDEARSISGLGDSFAQYDKNGDGQLSRSEYEAARKAGGKADGAGAQTGSGGGEKSRY